MPQTRRLDLDGLRGLAVLLVVGFHAGIPALRGAFVAVDIFFVLSGFFLASTLARSLATGEEVRPSELLSRRIWRLFPALVVVLLGTLATSYWYAPIDRGEVTRHLLPVSAFVGNLAFAADGVNYFRAGENPLLHTWTLGVELQLALLLPLVVMWCAAWGERRAGDASGSARREIVARTVILGLGLLVAMSFALAVILNERAPMWAYFGPHTRLWSFGAGALMAFVTGGGQSLVGLSVARLTLVQLAGLGLLMVPALWYESTLAYPGVVALAPVGGTLLLLATGSAAARALPGRLLASAPLAGLGTFSYGWYLWHWPLIVLGTVLAPTLGVTGKFVWGIGGLLAAYLSWRVLGHPRVAALVHRVMGDRPVWRAALVTAGMALLAAGVSWSNNRFVQGSVHRVYRDARNDHMEHACWGGPSRDRDAPACAFGDEGSNVTIALLGDSHASHWLGGLEQAGRTHAWRIEPHVMGGCPVADLRGLVQGAAERLYRDCAAFQEETMQRLEAAPPQVALLSNADYYIQPPASRAALPGLPDSVWREGLRRTYARLDRMGATVVVMRALPWVPFDVPSCLSRRAADLAFAQECTFEPDLAFMTRAQRTQTEAATGLPVRFIDLNDRVCGTSRVCATERDGVVLYTDDNHITRSFSRALGATLGDRLARALAR